MELVVHVYVDDLIIVSNDHMAIHCFKLYPSDCFHMKDLVNLKYFLGVEVATCKISNRDFFVPKEICIGYYNRSWPTWSQTSPHPSRVESLLVFSRGAFALRSYTISTTGGRLIYLYFTRPVLSYCVHILSQFMQQPREKHWHAALRVVQYLKGQPGQGILLRRSCDLNLYGWCDLDWASCPLTRRSLTGWFILLGNSPISWKTKKQHTVSRLSVEAEYCSMATTTCELKWVKCILSSLGMEHSKPIHLYCDSQAALHMAKNAVFHERTKHIEVDSHFVRDEIIKNNVCPSYVPTSTQLADIFTKALGTKQFSFLLGKLGIQNLYAPT